MDGRRRTDSYRSAHRTRLTGRLRGSVLVLSPHRAGRAGVADDARLVHRPQGERVVAPAEEAVHLDAPPIVAGEDADVADRAAADAAGSRDRPSLLSSLHWIQRHPGDLDVHGPSHRGPGA